jgi:hypothetical protein
MITGALLCGIAIGAMLTLGLMGLMSLKKEM